MPPKRSRAIELDPEFSDDDAHNHYPQELVREAQNEIVESPTKALRQYQHPLARATVPKSRKHVKKSRIEEQKEERFWIGEDSRGLGVTFEVNLEDGGGFEESGLDDRPTVNSSPVRQPSLSHITEAHLSLYADAVESYSAGFYYIEDSLFAVEGWNVAKEESNGHWYHLQQISEDGQISAVCTCPAALQSVDCVHRAYIVEFVREPLEGDALDATVHKDHRVAVFSRQQVPNSEEFETMFSVGSPFHHGLKGRVIVTHLGSLPTAGTWTCSKSHSGAGNCAHIPAARKMLLALLEVQDEVEDSGNEDMNDTSVEAPQGLLVPPQAVATLSRHGSVSYLPVLPPVSVMLKSDVILYPRPAPFRSAPTQPLRLTATSTCPCPGPTRSVFKTGAAEEIEVGRCRIYTMLGMHHADIETQRCPNCPGKKRRCIGPDLRETGLFNYNNRVIVSHELLDEYTISFASSETPFTAFVMLMDHRYMSTGAKFMGEDLFRAVWFSYVSIQAFEDDMRCALCGPTPDTIIWDGVTVAFHKKHLSPTIRPPTTITPHSLPRPLVKPLRSQQLIVDAALRKDIRLVIKSFRKDKHVYFEDDDDDDDDDEADESQTQVEVDVARIDSVSERLSELCPALSMLFLSKYGYVAYLNKKRPLVAYRSFFLQVAAEESILQMVNAKSLGRLREFNANPTPGQFFKVASIPALFQLLRHHGSTLALLPILKWVELRAATVLKAITVDKRPLPVFPKGHVVADWRLTGCFYSLAHIRDRPTYRGIRHDRTKEDSQRGGDTCGKYFDEYGKDGMSGGIMAGWCTHSVCYGFHCIPSSEGRDDVFSAMVTRWPVAPKHVIYDFACALGPYCMLREPEFFKDTLFAIDDFHAQGHTKCSPAAFLLEYASADPRLVAINSSAGECGNSALRRIRKSISYMSQERAVIYTKTFLSIWNRTRIIKKKL
ncbi:hypothetical protein D9611_001108 [Ephemerocybe angulata]|uniref:SWIM-type domain-containing protein n=1 Tax=Ephemerocybe angulata TaxID=980116 RepID=A0A8H5CKI1_9AGAR|nr:hypothetical protein D9611_001108 [Tulosesus angulatus]